MTVVATFGEWMQERRRSLGVRYRKDFVDRTRVAATIVWELETGKGKPFHERRDVIKQAVARELRVSVAALDAYSRGEIDNPMGTGGEYEPQEGPLTLPADLSASIRMYANREGIDPIDFVARAIRRTLKVQDPPGNPAPSPAPQLHGVPAGQASKAKHSRSARE